MALFIAASNKRSHKVVKRGNAGQRAQVGKRAAGLPSPHPLVWALDGAKPTLGSAGGVEGALGARGMPSPQGAGLLWVRGMAVASKWRPLGVQKWGEESCLSMASPQLASLLCRVVALCCFCLEQVVALGKWCGSVLGFLQRRILDGSLGFAAGVSTASFYSLSLPVFSCPHHASFACPLTLVFLG